MVPLEAAARRLGIELDALVRRLELRDIVIVGRGHRARITEADLDRVRAAVVPIADEWRVLPVVRSVGLLGSIDQTQKVAPLVSKPKR